MTFYFHTELRTNILNGYFDSRISVRVGEYDVDSDPDCDRGVCAPPVQDIDVEEFISHPEFVPECDRSFNHRCEKTDKQLLNDIALLRLAKPIEFHGKATLYQ